MGLGDRVVAALDAEPVRLEPVHGRVSFEHVTFCYPSRPTLPALDDFTLSIAGRQPDIFIKPDDQVLVGTNLIAPYLAALRNAFRFTYGAGFIYDKNFAYEDEVVGPGGV